MSAHEDSNASKVRQQEPEAALFDSVSANGEPETESASYPFSMGTNGPTTLAKLRGLPWSIAGNSLNSIFAQFTFFGSVFVLFLDTLGLSKAEIGGLLSLLPFTSVLAIFVAPYVARLGYKRTFLTAYGVRTIVSAFLLLTPWVAATYGSAITLRFVAAIVATFAILRALMEISLMPWLQEYVPNSVRGKYTARDNMFVTATGVVAILTAGAVIERITGLSGYLLLFVIAVLIGFVALWCFSFIPGGSAKRVGATLRSLRNDMHIAFSDPNYLRYIIAVCLLTFGITAAIAFLPLYLQEQKGIDAGWVIWIQIGALLGALLSSSLWGWAADRYGSNPVSLLGAALLALVPILWWWMPGGTALSTSIALMITIVQGIASSGWVIGAGHLLHVTLVPSAYRAGYMALYSALLGIVAGTSQLLAGSLLNMTQGQSIHIAFLAFDPYVPLFLVGTALAFSSVLVLRNVRADNAVSIREFAGIFFGGNPFMAMSSMIRIQLAKDERSTVLRLDQLGRSGSRLTVEELIDALSDPRFAVRYEATGAIARMRHDPRLTQAMLDLLLHGTELPLSVQAAWALGRMGDPEAIPALRDAAKNPYRSIQVHSIRSLGLLGDTESIPCFLADLLSTTDPGLKMAYASALGSLGATEAAGELLALLDKTQNTGARLELALALARLAGHENVFIRLQRQIHIDPGTGSAQALSGLKRHVRTRTGWRKNVTTSPLETAIEESIQAFANNDIAQGESQLSAIIEQLPADRFDELTRQILHHCADRLAQDSASSMEYLILAFYYLDIGWHK